MRKRKADKGVLHVSEIIDSDPFFRRREAQGSLIKKMLAKIDLPHNQESEIEPEDLIDNLSFDITDIEIEDSE
jgi:hypothetical protein